MTATVTPEHRAEVRAWGIANRIPGAHPKGIVAQSVFDAFYAAGNPRPDDIEDDDRVIDGAGDEPPLPGEQGDDEDTVWVQLNVPGMDPEAEEALCEAVLLIVDASFKAGRQHAAQELRAAVAQAIGGQ